MPSQTIQWFPGHMAKTRRLISESLSLVDIVFELLDARIPKSSKNPEIDRLTAGKPKLILLTKSSMADPNVTEQWVEKLRSEGQYAIATDTVTGEGIKSIVPCVRKILKEKIEKNESRGMVGKQIRVMILGIPNVGKSSLVNRLGGGKKAKVENRPGVTVNRQWVTTSLGLELLDMPGVLWPKFDDRITGENLAFTGAIKDAVLDTTELAALLCERLCTTAKTQFCERYKIDESIAGNIDRYKLLEAVAEGRKFIVSGGEYDYDRTAGTLLTEFRDGKIGRISLERP
ncbi:MAG: ribosome biogenesis GTPase YlqF [Clostridia bacterium]|nr:ribosome biogenesis GTPase YlqF [Clostridia bacterium]